MIIPEQSCMFPSTQAKLNALFPTNIAMRNHKPIPTFNFTCPPSYIDLQSPINSVSLLVYPGVQCFSSEHHVHEASHGICFISATESEQRGVME